jgi:exodeoxyribonuclease V alpha subunit
LANEISSGKVVAIPPDATDIQWHEAVSETFEASIKMAIKQYLKSDKDMDDLQIIAPMYRGNCGVNKINEIVQAIMVGVNKTESQYLQRGFTKFHLQDRVIQTENDYDKEVFNGDMGKITALGQTVRNSDVNDKPESFVTVNFYGEEKTYFDEEIEKLRLAWCITVHKYQGSQSPYVFFVMSNEARNMMSKELVYTAFTRAEKRLDVYGNIGMFHLAPTRSSIRKRYTNINKLIREHRENRKLLKVLE